MLFKPLTAAGKVVLLISQHFPQIPIKPLHTITPKPITEKVTFEVRTKQIVGDLFIPKSSGKHSGIIVVMGIDTSEKDKPIILGFCETLARLGYVAFWPRSEELDKGMPGLEEPEVFVKAFEYLGERPEVDSKRISFVGFSVGSSIAMVAAQDQAINKKVHSLVFFGGYYNALDYVTSLATKTMIVNGQTSPWEPSESAVSHVEKILAQRGTSLEHKGDDTRLLRYSPDQKLDTFKAAIFILHEKADSFVPYAESVKLKQALEAAEKKPQAFHLANLFEHVQPKKGFSPEIIREFVGLFGFLHKVFMYL